MTAIKTVKAGGRTLTDLDIDYRGEYAANEMKYSVGCNSDGARYHIWLNAAGEVTGNTLYKNPPLETKPGTKGYFSCKRLNANAAVHRPMIEALLEFARENMTAARFECADKEAAKREENRLTAIEYRKEKSGREAFELLRHARAIINACGGSTAAERAAITAKIDAFKHKIETGEGFVNG